MLQSLFNNTSSTNGGMQYPWQTPPDQRKTINSTSVPNILGNQAQQPSQTGSSISGVQFNKPTGWVDEFGGNGELTGQSQWGNYFSGLENLGEGYDVQDVIGQGYAGVGGAPSSFTIRRQDPNGDPNYYQQRQLTVNPDGTVSWATDSNWKSVKQQSQMGHFMEAGLPMALAMVGAMGATGGLGGLFGASEGLSGMDLAADAAIGSGNNIMTAGQGLTGAGGLAGTSIPGYTQAPEYGKTVATLADSSGASPFTGGATAANDPITAYLTTGASEGSTIGGSLFGGGASGAVGEGTIAGTLGSIMNNPVTSFLSKNAGGISNLSNLASMFSNYKQYSNTGDLIDDIKGIYSPDGVYAKELEKQLARRDAAAGRNSQYGPRLAELMAKLGDSQARSLSGLGGMYQTQQGGLNGMLGSGVRLLENGSGVLDKIFSIFGD